MSERLQSLLNHQIKTTENNCADLARVIGDTEKFLAEKKNELEAEHEHLRSLETLEAITRNGLPLPAPGDIAEYGALAVRIGRFSWHLPDEAPIEDLRLYAASMRRLYEVGTSQARRAMDRVNELEARAAQATQETGEIDQSVIDAANIRPGIEAHVGCVVDLVTQVGAQFRGTLHEVDDYSLKLVAPAGPISIALHDVKDFECLDDAVVLVDKGEALPIGRRGTVTPMLPAWTLEGPPKGGDQDEAAARWLGHGGQLWDLKLAYQDCEGKLWRWAGGYENVGGNGYEPLMSRQDRDREHMDVPIGAVLAAYGPLTAIQADDPLEPLPPNAVDSRADVAQAAQAYAEHADHEAVLAQPPAPKPSEDGHPLGLDFPRAPSGGYPSAPAILPAPPLPAWGPPPENDKRTRRKRLGGRRNGEDHG